MEFEISPFQREQLLMGAALNNAALVEEKNLISMHDTDETMRDDDRGVRAGSRFKCSADALFRACVYCCSGVIENKDRRIGQCTAGDVYSLSLPTLYLHPFLTHPSLLSPFHFLTPPVNLFISPFLHYLL